MFADKTPLSEIAEELGVKIETIRRYHLQRYGIDARKRRIETIYWQRIATLMAEGLTPEQAREKIYQDLLEKGDLEGAKWMREYQDVVHPLKANDQLPPPSPREPPSPT